MILPVEIIEVLNRTSVSCPSCSTGRLEIISDEEVFCPECSRFYQVQKGPEKPVFEKGRGVRPLEGQSMSN